MARRFGAPALALAVVLAFMLGGWASAEGPITGVRVVPVKQFNELEARVTAAEQQLADQAARLDALEATPAPPPTPDPTETPAPDPTEEPTPTPDPEPTEDPTPAPDPEPVPAGDFPTRASVGPAVDPTEVWTGGDCYFNVDESGTVVDGKILECGGEGVRFHKDATGIVFRNSIIRGGMMTPGVDDDGGEGEREPIFTVEDSKIIQNTNQISWPDRALYGSHYTVRRSLIQGSHSGVGAHTNVVLTGNFITTDGTDTHSSGVRMLKNSVLRGNTVTCKPVNAGFNDCSAHAVFYREAISGANAPAFNLTIEDNYFKRGTTAGGADGGPYFAVRFIDCANWTDCTGISFQGNQFSLGEGTDGREFPFYADNVWADNVWADGQPALSGQSR